MDQCEVGSWSRAVTSADSTWMTSNFHSKNTTFSVANGALLYHKHLCQSGRDKIVKEEGTSKGAEVYAAQLTFKMAKEDGYCRSVARCGLLFKCSD